MQRKDRTDYILIKIRMSKSLPEASESDNCGGKRMRFKGATLDVEM